MESMLSLAASATASTAQQHPAWLTPAEHSTAQTSNRPRGRPTQLQRADGDVGREADVGRKGQEWGL